MSNTDKGVDPHLGSISQDEREAFRRRANELDARLDKADNRRQMRRRVRRSSPWASSGAGRAMRFAVELIVGVGVGGFIGWFLDGQFGTRPILLVVFLMLGFAAAILNIVRAAKELQAEAEPLQRAASPIKDDDEDDG